ncbi:MAG: DNA-3-methyladenine glycosylase [Candidatus Dormibacteria bacterium]|jgi:DNA-3-methyladenine glycosylase
MAAPASSQAAPALARGFFAGSTLEVATALIGSRLLCDPGTPREVRAVIVEVEAYLGEEDPASHAHRGPTPRAAIMFGPPGHLYVYLSYGMHFCANVVCEPEGVAGAVLLRAAAVEVGEEVVRARRVRGGRQPATSDLLSGPGNLGAGLGLALADNGLDLCAPGSRVRILERETVAPLARAPRVGITRAADRPFRFAWAGHPAVSRPIL